MIKYICHQLAILKISLPFAGWWLDCKGWWLSRERDYFPLVLLVGLGSIISICGIMLAQFKTQQAEQRQLTCLALNVYHEARGEPVAGQYAVAKVTLNRVASPRYPGTVCEVVYQKNWDRIRGRYVGAFSWTEFDIKPALKNKEWQQALRVAEDLDIGEQLPELEGALFYHAKSIRPSWARHKKPVARIGHHVFYR